MILEKFVSERTALLWVFSTMGFTLALALFGGLVVLGIDGCWPIGTNRGSSNCLAQIEPGFLRFLPPVLGIVAGTVWTIRERKAK